MRKSEMLKNIAVLASSAALGRVIAFLAIPVLTRIYTPEQFGIFAIFAALVATAVPLASLRYCVAIPLPAVRMIAACLVVICLFSATIISGLLAILVFFIGESRAVPAVLLSVSDYLWAVPVATIGGSIFEVLQFWALRTKKIGALARAQVLQSFLSAAVKIALGAYLHSPLGLVVGHIVQIAGGGLELMRSAFLDLHSFLGRFTVRRLCFVLTRYKDYPLYRLPSQFLLVVASQFPVLMIATLFGSEDAGQFSLAFNSLAVPIGIVSQSVGNAFYVEIASVRKNAKSIIRSAAIALILRLAIFSIIPALSLALWGSAIFQMVFGDNWIVAGLFAESLAISLFAQVLLVPIVHVLTVLNKNFDLLWINFSRVVLIILISGVASAFSLDAQQVVLMYSLAMFAHYVSVGFRVNSLLLPVR